ncbi:MAG: carbohydrate kinase family protein, partial [Chloroflexota bacterium]
YLRCTSHADLSRMGRLPVADPSRWANVELWSPCFQVDAVGTNGSGDATIAGFLAALLRGAGPQDAVRAAVGVGACNVEAADALSGILSWEDTQERIRAGWAQRALILDAPGWKWDAAERLWVNVGSQN